ncbi:TPA: DNA helicase, variant 2 [Trebouxia sp. C0006]
MATLSADVKVQYSDPAGTFLHTSTGKQVEVLLRHGHRPGTAEIEIGLPKMLSLPIQPPMALLANKTGDGMLGLRWCKIKLGCGSSAVVKTVQVMLSHGDPAAVQKLGQAINASLAKAASRPLQPLSSNIHQVSSCICKQAVLLLWCVLPWYAAWQMINRGEWLA